MELTTGVAAELQRLLNVKDDASPRPRVLIVGGGYSGACAAIHLLHERDQALDIALIEPAARVGGGLAHSTSDPDHRLNAPAPVHVVLPDRPPDLETWLRAEGRIDRDPESMHEDALFPRRSDFGDYVRAQLEAAARESISRFEHLRERAAGIARVGGRWRITLEAGTCLDADGCIVATGHERPRPPAFMSDEARASARYFNDPWDLAALSTLDPQSDVLLIGTATTAADVIATLLRRGHAGRITALSRHGYRSAGRNLSPSSPSLWEAINDPVPEFVARHGAPGRVIDILRILRSNIAEQVKEGRTWHIAFDEVRNSARHLWAGLPEQEKRRFLRHARAFYDPHRFRLAPQTERVFNDALSCGQLTLRAGRISSISPLDVGFDVEYRMRHDARTTRERFGAIVNCSGPEISARHSSNPLIRSLLESGVAREDIMGLGLATNSSCQAVGANGDPVEGLYFLGPLTRGLMGETPAVPLITWQVLTLIPRLLSDMRVTRRSA